MVQPLPFAASRSYRHRSLLLLPRTERALDPRERSVRTHRGDAERARVHLAVELCGRVPASDPLDSGSVGNRWFRPATILVPTLRSWLVLAFTLLVAAWLSAVYVHDYLAPTEPLPDASVLLVEAGPSPGVVRYVKGLVDAGRYERIVVVGTPIDHLSPLAALGTDADLWAARLQEVGVDRRTIEVIRVPGLPRYRTAHKALAVRRHLETRPATRVDLVSPTTHARRSWLIYQQALAPTRVGVRSAPQPYDSKEWWNSSAGVRAVVGELLALAYFYVGRDEVAQAKAEWGKLPPEVRHVSGPTVLGDAAE